MTYAIIDSARADELAAFVNKRIADGWKPLGGVSVSLSHDAHGGSYQMFAQAMIKETV
jgi:hypothetical protein